jgi:hypothetical protein
MNSIKDTDEDFDTEDSGSDSVSDSVEEAAPAPRKRGRPLGVKVGPRAVVWLCAGVVDGDLCHERFSAPDGSDFDKLNTFSSEDAKAAFMEMYGEEPESILGPFYDKKGIKTATSVKKRETVALTAPKLTTKRENAIYRGWKGIAYAIEGRDDVVYFMYDREVIQNADKKKTAPAAKVIFRAALEFQESSR